jgi:hypothetical protein
MLPKVIDARHAGGYKVWLRFADGLRGEIDLSVELCGKASEPLRAIDASSKFRVYDDLDTIVWPTGADLSPQWLHDRLEAPSKAAAAERDLGASFDRFRG